MNPFYSCEKGKELPVTNEGVIEAKFFVHYAKNAKVLLDAGYFSVRAKYAAYKQIPCVEEGVENRIQRWTLLNFVTKCIPEEISSERE